MKLKIYASSPDRLEKNLDLARCHKLLISIQNPSLMFLFKIKSQEYVTIIFFEQSAKRGTSTIKSYQFTDTHIFDLRNGIIMHHFHDVDAASDTLACLTNERTGNLSLTCSEESTVRMSIISKKKQVYADGSPWEIM